MQQFFLESPLWLCVCGLFVALVAGFVWTQTGSRAALLAAVVTAALTVVFVFVSVSVETDREQVNRTIHEVADAVEANDLRRVTSYIHPSASEGIERAKNELPQYVFREARMTRLSSILVNPNSNPPTAVAEFHVIVDVEANGQKVRLPRFVKAYFVQDEGNWLVRDYEHFDAGVGFRN